MGRASTSVPSGEALPDGDPSTIVRRAPFADSPYVGERGQKAQMRILEAALEVFGEVGYHGCGIKRITELSGCSRASFYQYFSSKEDLFRHLAGRVVKQLNESTAALGPITGDVAGWESFHQWLERYSAIYDTYEPVFVTFDTAVVSDTMVASGVSVVAARTFTRLRAKIVDAPLTSDEVDAVVRTLLQTVARINRETELLEQVTPKRRLDRTRVNVAFADAFHRALFGPLDGVNVHTSTQRLMPMSRTPKASASPDADGDGTHGPVAQRTRAQLLEAGHQVFVERGYYATRVADIVEAAGVSHGVFYRYFDNKASLFGLLAVQASRQLTGAVDAFPDLFAADPATDPAADLRTWLSVYASTYAEEAAIFAMWSEAISRDGELGDVSAAAIDASRARLARFLQPRGWGDADADAMVLLVYLDAMTSHRITPARIEGIAQMIERGLLRGPSANRRAKRR